MIYVGLIRIHVCKKSILFHICGMGSEQRPPQRIRDFLFVWGAAVLRMPRAWLIACAYNIQKIWSAPDLEA